MSGNSNSGVPKTIIPNFLEMRKRKGALQKTLAEAAGVALTVVRRADKGLTIRVTSAQFLLQALDVCTFCGKRWRAVQ